MSVELGDMNSADTTVTSSQVEDDRRLVANPVRGSLSRWSAAGISPSADATRSRSSTPAVVWPSAIATNDSTVLGSSVYGSTASALVGSVCG